MNRIRLMTANLLNDRVDEEHLAALIERIAPEVVVTQELGPSAARVLEATFPHHLLSPAMDHRGRGIAGRLPAQFGELPLAWRPGMWARIRLDSAKLVVATLHMRNAVTPPWWRSVRIRGRQLEDLFRWADEFVAADEALVIAGDMNASPAWPVYRRIAGRWDDLVAAAAEANGAGLEPTWGWRPGWPRMLRIDHVFGAGARVTHTSVEPIKGSDHAAVVVDLEVLT